MTENNSPENLRKFLESDDPALVMMGLSMAKGSGVPEEMLGEILWMYMMHDDKTIRAAAKSTFMKIAPKDAKQIVKENWKASYRTQWLHREWENAMGRPKISARYIAELVNELFPSVSLIKPLIKLLNQICFKKVHIDLLFPSRNITEYQLHLGLMDALKRIGEPAIEPIVKNLAAAFEIYLKYADSVPPKGINRTIKINTEYLGKSGHKGAIKPLIHILKSTHPYSQQHNDARKALEKLGHEVE